MADEFRLPDLEALPEIGDRLDAATALVEKADRDGVLPDLPRSPDEVREESMVASRLLTIRTRLHLLGYLRRDNESPKLDDKLVDAVESFQTEAGLAIDRWVGPQTWAALQQLVDFETPFDVGRWARPEAKKALLRAVRLRLFVLGCLDSRRASTTRLTRALRRFSDVTWMLRITEKRLPSQLVPEFLAVLFDQDGLVASLAALGSSFTIRRPDEISSGDANAWIKRFLISAAHVELWLLGYDLSLDGRGRFPRPTSFPYQRTRFPFFYALEHFWRSRGLSITDARGRAGALDPSFFTELETIGREAESAESLRSDAVYDEIVKLSPRSQRTVWNHVRSVGSRIWDGVKRIWRWFTTVVGRVRKVIHKVFQWTKNLARFAFRYALRSFTAVRRAVGRTVASIRFFLSKTVPGSDPSQVFIRRDADLDYTLIVNPGRDPARVEAITGNLAHQARVFSAGIRVLSKLVGYIIKIVKATSWPVGWFGFVLALVRLFRDLRHWSGFAGDDIELLTAV
ncbi:MAG: peptidoglycan-binding domain-containing protein [Acidobacteriota bacterium]